MPTQTDLELLIRSALGAVAAENPSVNIYASNGDDHLERALVFRFALHLDRLVLAARDSWAAEYQRVIVDVELSRISGGMPKLSRLPRARGPNRSTDVVVHARGPTGKNLLALEIKPNSEAERRARDVAKLKELLGPSRAFAYAARIVVSVDGFEPTIEWVTLQTV
jgi:hypothetical protein